MKNTLALMMILLASQLGGLDLLGQAPGSQTPATSNAPVAHSASKLTNEQRTWLAPAHRHEKHGWVYLHVEGQPRERGFQHGYLLAREIAESLRVMKAVWEYKSGMDWPWLVGKSTAILGPKVDGENLAEHAQFDWMQNILKSRPSRPWTEFRAGERE